MQVIVDTALSRNCDDPAECRQCDFDKEDHNIGQSEPEDVDEVPNGTACGNHSDSGDLERSKVADRMHEDGNVAMKLVAAATATGTGSAKNPARGEASAYGKF